MWGADKEDKKVVDKSSPIFMICNAQEAYHAQGTHANEIPSEIYDNYAKSAAQNLKSGYFAKTTKQESQGSIDVYCFEPGLLPTIKQLQQDFPSYKTVPSLPSYSKPGGDAKVPFVTLGVKPDNSLFSGRELFTGICVLVYRSQCTRRHIRVHCLILHCLK